MPSWSLDCYEVKRPYFLHLADSRRISLHQKSAHRTRKITVVAAICRTCSDQNDTDLLIDFFKKMVSIDTVHLGLFQNTIEGLRSRKEFKISFREVGWVRIFIGLR